MSVGPAGLTGIYVNVTIPNEGSVCVDEYRASISGIPTSMSTLTKVVTSVTQRVYSFRFPVDLCSELLTGVSATANAITGDISGPSLTVEPSADTVNRSGIYFAEAIFAFEGCNLRDCTITCQFMTINPTRYNCMRLFMLDLINSVFTSQMFTSSGTQFMLINDVSHMHS